jgi:hypothetical protein
MGNKHLAEEQGRILKMDDSKSQIRNPKYQIGLVMRTLPGSISNFGFRI